MLTESPGASQSLPEFISAIRQLLELLDVFCQLCDLVAGELAVE
jgi:hypothetical protein